MVQLLVRLVAPPGRADDIMQALRTVLRPAQADRRCTWAQMYRAEDDPQLISYVEEWTSERDLASQTDTDRFSRLLSVLEAAAQPPVFEVRFVSKTRGLEYVASTRAVAGKDAI